MLPSLRTVCAESWDALAAADHPFTRYAYLRGLEVSGTVGAAEPANSAGLGLRGLRGQDSRWSPMHLLVLNEADAALLEAAGDEDALPDGVLRPIAAAPCYVKGD